MQAGLQVINDSGILQIDGGFKNLCLISKGSVSFVPSNNPTYLISYPVSSRPTAMIAFNTRGSVAVFAQSDGFSVRGIPESSTAGSSLDFEYFIFDKPEYSGVTGTYGLQVFGSDGLEVFDSAKKYMRIAAYFGTTIEENGTFQ
ncbi:hypothetical protein [Pseudomonas sp. LRF_L74]|uniref:hypothetical protein n=1 Tax=Pseudomonas sp. LRF_L74 TaxID=3369422 RepID=UPI003F606A00